MSILERLGLKSAGDTAETPASGKVVKVGPGDTLAKIALREYGDEAQWERIYEANKSKVREPDSLYPGMELVIPQD